jgi:hypothetical protein
VTATLSGERSIRVATDDQTEIFEGALPSVISGDSSSLELVARGGPADGDRLVFAPLASAAPPGPGPDAVFKMRFFSFGAPYAIRGYSPVLFDGSGSHGDGLSYFISFGDGQVSTEVSPTHSVDREGTYRATLTVVDRFGRSDEESLTYRVESLVASGYYIWWEGGSTSARVRALLNFLSQDGESVAGVVRFDGLTSDSVHDFSGKLSGEDQVHLALAGTEIVLSGTMRLSGNSGGTLVLTQTGGSRHGQVFEFYFRNGY